MNVLYGRSSSHFTRVARIFAAELEVPYTFEIIRDILSTDASKYGNNPALKLPTLQTSSSKTPSPSRERDGVRDEAPSPSRDRDGVRDTWFGTLNICRELARQSETRKRVVWPEDSATALAANAQEYVQHAMSTEVTILMNRFTGGDTNSKHQQKLMTSLVQTMSWLENNHDSFLRELPRERDLSYLEVTLFCLVEHLEFREVLSTESYSALRAFAHRFAERESARMTPYRLDT